MVSVVFLSHLVGGDDGIRTHDPLLAGQVLSQLSYTPISLWSFAFSLPLFCLLLRCPEIFISGYLNVSTELSSRTVARKVFSPLQSLTSVFGMGTGGPSAFVAPTPTFFEKKVGKETLNNLMFSFPSVSIPH